MLLTRKLYRYLLRLKISYLYVLTFIICKLVVIIFGTIKYYLIPSSSISTESLNVRLSFSRIILSIAISPFIETFISQKVCIAFFKSFYNKNIACVLLSSILFGLLHWRDISTMIIAGIMGITLGLFYTILKRKGDNALMHTTLLHSFFNLFSVIVSFVFKL